MRLHKCFHLPFHRHGDDIMTLLSYPAELFKKIITSYSIQVTRSLLLTAAACNTERILCILILPVVFLQLL